MSMRKALMNGTVPLLSGMGTFAFMALAGSLLATLAAAPVQAQETMVIGGGQLPRWTRDPQSAQTASLPSGRNVVVDYNGAGSASRGTAPRPTLQWPGGVTPSAMPAPMLQPPTGPVMLRPPSSAGKPVALRPPGSSKVAAQRKQTATVVVENTRRGKAGKAPKLRQVAQAQPPTVVISGRGVRSQTVAPAETSLADSGAGWGTGHPWSAPAASAPAWTPLPPAEPAAPMPATLLAAAPPPPAAAPLDLAGRTLPRSVSQRMTADELTRLYNSALPAAPMLAGTAAPEAAPQVATSAPTWSARPPLPSGLPFLAPPTPQNGRPVGAVSALPSSPAIAEATVSAAPPGIEATQVAAAPVAMAPAASPSAPTPLRPSRPMMPPSFPPALPATPVMPIPQAPVTTMEPLVPRQTASAPPPLVPAPPASGGPPTLDPPLSLEPVAVARAPSIARTAVDGIAEPQVAMLPPAAAAPDMAPASLAPIAMPATPLAESRAVERDLPARIPAMTLAARPDPEPPARNESVWAARVAEPAPVIPAAPRTAGPTFIRSAAAASLPATPVAEPVRVSEPVRAAEPARAAVPPPAVTETASVPAPAPVSTRPARELAALPPAPGPVAPSVMLREELPPAPAITRAMPPPAGATTITPSLPVSAAPMPAAPPPSEAAPPAAGLLPPAPLRVERALPAMPAVPPPPPPAVTGMVERTARPELVVPPAAEPPPPTPDFPGSRQTASVALPPPLPRAAEPRGIAVGRGDSTEPPGARSLAMPPTGLMSARPGAEPARPAASAQLDLFSPPPVETARSAPIPPPPAEATRLAVEAEAPPPPAPVSIRPDRNNNSNTATSAPRATASRAAAPVQVARLPDPAEAPAPAAVTVEPPAPPPAVASVPAPPAPPPAVLSSSAPRAAAPSESVSAISSSAPPLPSSSGQPTALIASRMAGAPPPAGPSAISNTAAPARTAAAAPSVLSSSAPPATVAAARAPQAEPTRIAPRTALSDGDSAAAMADARPVFTIPFSGEAADVSDNGRNRLRDLAKQMAGDPRMQVQIFAYASGSDETASKARRLSLSRALSVRALLLDEGIRSTRIEVRPLGNQTAKQPADRVDVMTSGTS